MNEDLNEIKKAFDWYQSANIFHSYTCGICDGDSILRPEIASYLRDPSDGKSIDWALRLVCPNACPHVQVPTLSEIYTVLDLYGVQSDIVELLD